MNVLMHVLGGVPWWGWAIAGICLVGLGSWAISTYWDAQPSQTPATPVPQPPAPSNTDGSPVAQPVSQDDLDTIQDLIDSGLLSEDEIQALENVLAALPGADED